MPVLPLKSYVFVRPFRHPFHQGHRNMGVNCDWARNPSHIDGLIVIVVDADPNTSSLSSDSILVSLYLPDLAK
jgi:hypothetical protein